jgi:murein DD-endopeptidase MepM/ murein hydrolase activator NlpD
MARHEPYLQASRPEAPTTGRQPWRRSLPFVASIAILAAFVVVLSAAPRGEDAHAADPGSRGPITAAVTATGTPLPQTSTAPAPTPSTPRASAPTLAAPAETSAAPRPTDLPLDHPLSAATPSLPPDVNHVGIPSPTPPAIGDGSPGQPTDPPPTSAEPEKLTGYHWPLFHARITSFFERRDSGFLVVDGQRIHQGLDITTYCGDHVQAAHSGTVVAAGRRFADQIGFISPPTAFYNKYEKAGTMGELPIVVVVDDGNGYRSMYVHLYQASVKIGDHVKAGDTVGLEGMTGNATGCHLHYELVRMDGPWMRVAPEQVKENHYPAWQRARIDPLRVLSLKDPRAARLVPGINPPKVSPGLGHATAP